MPKYILHISEPFFSQQRLSHIHGRPACRASSANPQGRGLGRRFHGSHPESGPPAKNGGRTCQREPSQKLPTAPAIRHSLFHRTPFLLDVKKNIKAEQNKKSLILRQKKNAPSECGQNKKAESAKGFSFGSSAIFAEDPPLSSSF